MATFVFNGRSRRLDVAYYCLASGLFSGLGRSLARHFLPSDSAAIAGVAFGALLSLPLFGLFVRRLHDFGRSGWLVLLLPPLLAIDVYQHLRVVFHPFDPSWPDPGTWQLALLPVALLMFAVMAKPGDVGANCYGPDPRLDRDEPAVA